MASSAHMDAQQPPSAAQTAENAGRGNRTGSDYWWLTSGHDIAHLMRESHYPDHVARQVLSYFRQHICPKLGDEVTPASKKSGLGWDGSPFEYGIEFKSTGAGQTVRFGVDLANLKAPAAGHGHDDDAEGVLSTTDACRVVETIVGRTPDFDDTWYRSLLAFFDQSQQTKERQLELAAQAGHQTPIIIGFDIHPSAGPSPPALPEAREDAADLPVLAKVYFPPCHTAAAKGQTRWKTICQAIHQLPDISAKYPVLLDSLRMIDDYLATKPESWQEGARYLATDFVSPDKSRLKVYMRYPGHSFDEMWDFYTLGGRIPAPEGDKALFRDLMVLTGPGSDAAGGRSEDYTVNSDLDYTNFRRKMSCIYFSLSAKNSTPASKMGIYPANFAASDGVIARGLDTWLQKYNWPLPERSIEEQLKSVFTHRSLEEKTGLFTFISVGRKEDPKKDLSLQLYLAPELYASPRDW
ncbi:hypothetical protein E4U42_000654 [Claviceps africana]|uniref:Aromatic prenyltransferase n=1 Tax=Claviceps africana TaxID=83212 RepID=A0A8K0J0H4_9HYPO|nr:hypothetical protein E4U42_000654 [Claviceps africana]